MVRPAPAEEAAWQKVTDPATLFATRCNSCHAIGFAPNLAQLSRMTTEEIEGCPLERCHAEMG